ncbi:unnamed protein product [Mytilus edulis]|uniref:Uncharacterized protein n=1 Tax=Mytilus edulis TaxID=6550 RepID=A0A8S3SRM5_MYTED|nr:unnamed protein product [Mytilus edulis]
MPPYGDIESCKNLRQCFKYCSKEDQNCEYNNVDGDYLHIHTSSYISGLRYERLNSASYPYCRMQGVQRIEFESRFQRWKNDSMVREMKEKFDKCILKPWQKATINLLNSQNDRTVLWIYDFVGNKGKTFLSNYLLSRGNFVIERGSTKDISYAFNLEKKVIFDFCRSQKDYVNYHDIECFKIE